MLLLEYKLKRKAHKSDMTKVDPNMAYTSFALQFFFTKGSQSHSPSGQVGSDSDGATHWLVPPIFALLLLHTGLNQKIVSQNLA